MTSPIPITSVRALDGGTVDLCNADPLCASIAAWRFAIAGQPSLPSDLCCFAHRAELDRRAVAADLPTFAIRVQPDVCQGCGQRVPEHLYAGHVGPFCRKRCYDRWELQIAGSVYAQIGVG